MIRKIHEAKINNQPSVVFWGFGKPRREFLHADDLASTLIYLINLDHDSFGELTNLDKAPLINIGTGSDLSIIDLAELIKDIIGFDGDFKFNTSMPDGTLRKVLNVEKINKLGWLSKIKLREGLAQTYQDYCYG